MRLVMSAGALGVGAGGRARRWARSAAVSWSWPASSGATPPPLRAAAEKLAGLRVFEDAAGKMNLDAAAVGGAFLVVSQFTLAGTLARGRRPSFDPAAPPAEAEPLVDAPGRPPPRRAAAGSRPAASAPTWRSSWSTTAR